MIFKYEIFKSGTISPGRLYCVHVWWGWELSTDRSRTGGITYSPIWFLKEKNLMSNIKVGFTYSTIWFLTKAIMWAIFTVWSHILQSTIWFLKKKQSYEQYLRCGSTIWFLKNAMSSADILTVWQQHFKTLTTDSNCLLTSKKFCTLPHSLADCLTWLDLMVKIFTGIYK